MKENSNQVASWYGLSAFILVEEAIDAPLEIEQAVDSDDIWRAGSSQSECSHPTGLANLGDGDDDLDDDDDDVFLEDDDEEDDILADEEFWDEEDIEEELNGLLGDEEEEDEDPFEFYEDDEEDENY